ncbi:maf protein [Tepidicaulis marinus]|jgi:septum formation protein|uniref:Nucleoside triphosphate pyrophosphatase n=1 Tax=Tepidicaulis marinus TaxID=1333998 RepID=A0A081B6P2_9HYPH|nr:Maf family protein [Tepidicaulis marinus]GAK43710.1 maf protein [Tepidicaulis marinus]
MMGDHLPLLLASASQVRADLLHGAGLPFDICVSPVDEEEAKQRLSSEPDALAMELARLKACAVSLDTPATLVIGADQVLSCEGKKFDKPRDMKEARKNLSFFRGKTHTLHSAVTLALDGEIVWSHGDRAHLTMRDFSDAFLDHYLRQAGEKILKSVGCYQLESVGVQLFEKIDGVYFTILGLPLLPLLEELRARKVILA